MKTIVNKIRNNLKSLFKDYQHLYSKIIEIIRLYDVNRAGNRVRKQGVLCSPKLHVLVILECMIVEMTLSERSELHTVAYTWIFLEVVEQLQRPISMELDCQELERLSTLTTRESVRNLLSQQIQVLKETVQGAKEPQQANEKGDAGPTAGAVSSSDVPAAPAPIANTPDNVPKPSESQKVMVSKLPTKTITSYGWDQSTKFVKVYVTLNGVQSLAREDITVEYTSGSMSLKVKKSDCIHQLVVNSLLQQIIPDKSHHKVKSDNMVILLKKREEKNWEYLTQTEKKAKQKGKPAAPKTNTADPSAGIMDLMKQMYDEGDDDMKRTIAQAWTQARDKKDTMDLP